MSMNDMVAELRGAVPKVPGPYCPTLIQRAWKQIRERNLWSFLLFDGQWISPPLFNTGSVSVVQGSNSVTLSADAAIALAIALPTTPYSLLTQRQFRVGAGGIYNIWGFTSTGYGDGGYGEGPYGGGILTLVLDRPYGEATDPQAGYVVFQSYYPCFDNLGPISDFKTWLSVRDMQNYNDLGLQMTRAELDQVDPQRLRFAYPTQVVPFMADKNPKAVKRGAMLFELWGAPQYSLAYQLYGLRRGSDLLRTDDLPAAVGDDCLMARARYLAYEWAEANKGLSPRSTGPDYRFLMGAAHKEYDTLLRQYRQADREVVDNWFFIRDKGYYSRGGFAHYNTISQTAGLGRF